MMWFCTCCLLALAVTVDPGEVRATDVSELDDDTTDVKEQRLRLPERRPPRDERFWEQRQHLRGLLDRSGCKTSTGIFCTFEKGEWYYGLLLIQGAWIGCMCLCCVGVYVKADENEVGVDGMWIVNMWDGSTSLWDRCCHR